MLLVVLDTETTGTDTSKDTVIEIAAALVDVDLKTIINTYSTLVHAEENPLAAFKINRIPTKALSLDVAINPDFNPILRMIECADCIVAHNVDFDKPMVDRLFKTYNIPEITKPWVCSYKDIDISGGTTSTSSHGCKKLTHIAADHGISALGAHRAMADVMILSQLLLLLETTPGALRRLIEDSKIPRKLYNAKIPPPWEDNGKGTALAKENGFRYNPNVKKWQKNLKESEINSFPFDVETP